VRKNVREWLETFLGGGSPFEADVRHILDNDDALRAEVKDLKARLKAAKQGVNPGGTTIAVWEKAQRACDLRNKNWRKP
jgi:hypothetical protein